MMHTIRPILNGSWDQRRRANLRFLEIPVEDLKGCGPVTCDDFRRLALSLPETLEGQHMGKADFRVVKKIFATLAFEKEGVGVLILTPEQQMDLVADYPHMFEPVAGGWGRRGCTRALLAQAEESVLLEALTTAWYKAATPAVRRRAGFCAT